MSLRCYAAKVAVRCFKSDAETPGKFNRRYSSAVGIFFGYYPARKAAALDPIEALRYE